MKNYEQRRPLQETVALICERHSTIIDTLKLLMIVLTTIMLFLLVVGVIS